MSPLTLACALLAFAPDALAWGLETHLFYAHWIVLTLPFVDRDLRRAVLSHPHRVCAGACLPDLALAGRLIGTPAFRRAHNWSTLRRMAAGARSDAELALAVGYGSHLVSDVVAHNEFVPEHEARIARVRHVTHAIAEFAMDQHVRGGLTLSASHVLLADSVTLGFVERAFRCPRALAQHAIEALAAADRRLRASPVPRLCAGIVRRYYSDLRHFDRYVSAVKTRLGRLEAALAGEFRDWVSSDPEGRTGYGAPDEGAGQHVARIVQT